MMSLKHTPLNILFCVLLIVMAISCKKGEDDPSVSIYTRHQRASGDWVLKEGKVTLKGKDTSGVYAEQTVSYSGDAYSMAVGGKGVFTGTHKLKLTLSDNGSFSYFEKFNKDEVLGKGTWDFLGKSSDYKNKERLLLNLGSTGVNSFFEYAFNKTMNAFQYQLKELSKKQMVMMVQDEPYYMDSKGNFFLVSAEYTFQR